MSKRTAEAESWFDSQRIKPSPPELGYIQNLIASIRFPTNSYSLSQDDLDVLNQLAGFLMPRILFGDQVEISLVGHTDFRGRASYNKWLGEQRLKAVHKHLELLVPRAPNFSFVWGVSAGEDYAPQGFRDELFLQITRCVEVWWGKPSLHKLPAMSKYSLSSGAGGPAGSARVF